MPPAWGAWAPYDSTAPAPRKRRVAAIAAAAGGGLLALALLIAAVVALTAAPTPREMAEQAGRNLETAAGAAYTGRYAGGPARVGVTRAGSGGGFFTAGGTRADEVEMDGATYLKAPAGFWRSDGVTAGIAGRLAGRWTRALQSTDDLYLPPLSPQKIGQGLRQAANEQTAATVRTTFNGAEVTKLAADGTTYYISRHRPYTVLRIEGTADLTSFAFDVTPLTPSTVRPVFATLRGDVRQLENAAAPSIRVEPINGGLKIGRCGASGCLARTAALASSYDSSIGSVRVTMSVTFRVAGHRPFTCVHTATVVVGRNTALYCRIGGRAWVSWYRSLAGRPIGHRSMSLDATQNSADDVKAMLRALATEQRAG